MDMAGSGGIGFVFATFGVVSLAWHVGVIVLLFLIWQKVRRLPG